jgi:hypothetical protein
MPVRTPSHAPSGANKTLTINEDTGYTVKVTDFGFSDQDHDSFVSIMIANLPSSKDGVYQLNGINLRAGQIVSVTDITAGKLVFTPAINKNGNNLGGLGFKVQDSGTSSNTDLSVNILKFNITPVNDAPSGTDKTIVIREDSTYTVKVTDFGFSDPDGHQFSKVIISSLPTATDGVYKLNGVNVTIGQSISVADIGNHKLVFIPAADKNGTALASLGFQVQDNSPSNNTDLTPNTLKFNITPVNDAPSGADKNITIDEDHAYTVQVADFGFSDPKDGNAFSKVIITSLPQASDGVYQLNGLNLVLGQAIKVTDISAGKLIFAPALDKTGTGLASLGFKVQDDGGTQYSGQNTDPTANFLTFNITPATPTNHPPVAVDDSYTMNEDGVLTLSPLAGDSDPDGTTPVLQSINGVALTGTTQTIEVSNGTVNIDAAGAITFSPAANFHGTVTIPYVISDGLATATANQLITVNPVNDAPVAANNTVTTSEDTAYIFSTADFGFSDPNDTFANNLLNVIITDAPTASMGSLKLNGAEVSSGQSISATDISSGALTFVPALNANSVNTNFSFNFKVQDDDGTVNGGMDTSSTANTITVSVTPVNDLPTGTVTLNNLGPKQGDVLTVSHSLVDVDGLGTISYIWKAGDTIIQSGSTDSYTLGQAEVGKVITVTASYTDGFGTLESVASAATAAVLNVNDAPTGIATAVLVNGSEDTVYVISSSDLLQGFSDLDGDSLAVSGLTATHGTLSSAGANWNFTPELNYNGAVALSYNVIDGNGGSIAAQQSFTLAAVNDAPSFINAPSVNYTDTVFDDSFATQTGTLQATDVDGNSLTFGIAGITPVSGVATASNAYGTLAVNTATGAYSFVANDAGIEASNSTVADTSLAFTVSDGIATVNQVFTINIAQSFASPNTGTESNGNDILTGTAGADVINALLGSDTISGLAGNDFLTGGEGADNLTGGLGKDTYYLAETTAATDIIHIAAGDSLVASFDVVNGFQLGVDQLDLANTTIAANDNGKNGTDSGLIKSHSISNGIISFDDINNYATSLTITSTNLTDVFGYLQDNIKGGQTVAFVEFVAAGNYNTYVFQDGGPVNDTLVELVGVQATSLSTTGTVADSVWIS